MVGFLNSHSASRAIRNIRLINSSKFGDIHWKHVKADELQQDLLYFEETQVPNDSERGMGEERRYKGEERVEKGRSKGGEGGDRKGRERDRSGENVK